MTKNYPEFHKHLKGLVKALGKEMPDSLAGFAELHRTATADGALSKSMKELIALGIGIAVRCDACIAYHVHDALKAGATRAEIVETIGVAVMMGGGPALMYGAQALEALEQFSEAQVPA
jgi:AhpD family alkylhydroperoxidase